MARHFAQSLDLQLFEPPVALQPFRVSMVWHARNEQDSVGVWLRGIVRTAAAEVLASEARRGFPHAGSATPGRLDSSFLEHLPECLACGSCCFSQLKHYVRVSGDDYARLAERAEELVEFDGHRAYMRMVDGHCAALAIDEVLGHFVCSAYEQRPQICRDLERSSGQCFGERHEKAERPLIALRRSC